jgi:hypothetical protein
MTQHTCPLCSDTLLSHVRRGKRYWFCHHCYQEMPDLETLGSLSGFSKTDLRFSPIVNLSLATKV